MSRSDTLSLLQHAICQNLVHVNGKLYRQSVGIPQVCGIKMLCVELDALTLVRHMC